MPHLDKPLNILVHLAHQMPQTGEPVDFCVPCKKRMFGRMKYGQLLAGEREPQFFPRNETG